MANVLSRVESLQIPELLTRAELNRLLTQIVLGEISLHHDNLKVIVDTLRDPELNEIIDRNQLTLGMIKPRLHESVVGVEGVLEDSELSKTILKQIQSPLDVVFSISLVMNQSMVDTWYEGKPKESQMGSLPMDEHRYGLNHLNRWQEFSSLMTSGPATFFLMHDKDGHAVENWRSQMGNDWNIHRVKTKYPDSLRARFGMDNHNNLLHGSDSPESVKREISLLANFIEKIDN